jgi:hypothetical protein
MKQAQDGIKASFEGFFKAFPEVKTIVWRQYTPYFNDGDECVFHVSELDFSPLLHYDVKDAHAEDYEDEKDRPFTTCVRYDYETVPNPDYVPGDRWRSPTKQVKIEGSEKYDERTTPELRKAMDDMQMLTSEDMEDSMRAAFGNHVWIKAYVKGGKVEFDVEDYEHD